MRAKIKAGRMAAAVACVLSTFGAHPTAGQRGGRPALLPAIHTVLAGRN